MEIGKKHHFFSNLPSEGGCASETGGKTKKPEKVWEREVGSGTEGKTFPQKGFPSAPAPLPAFYNPRMRMAFSRAIFWKTVSLMAPLLRISRRKSTSGVSRCSGQQMSVPKKSRS